MKKRDEGKASLVDFLSSIKFAQQNSRAHEADVECPTHFAHFKQSARSGRDYCAEDSQLIRSAN